MVSYSGSFPTIVYKQPTQPNIESGALWFNTNNNKMYYCDGLAYSLLSINTDFITEIVGQNALNILDLTAQASLTAGTNASFIRDTYKDANGYLNTIDTANTTALFSTNKYSFNGFETTANKDILSLTAQDGYNANEIVITATAKKNIIVNKVGCSWYDSGGQSYITIKKAGVTIASKTINDPTSYASFVTTDYSDIIYEDEVFTVHFDKGAGRTYFKNGVSDDNDYYSFNNQTTMGGANGILEVTEINLLDKNIVKINTNTLSFEPTYFMIVNNEVKTGNYNTTYDISFDDGVNFQTNVSPFNTYDIIDTGNKLQLIQNLNKSGVGTLSTYNYGVLIW